MNKDRFSALPAMITPNMISKIMDKYELDNNKAMALLHSSKVYKVLEKEDMKVWAANILKEYIKKGIAMDDKLLKELGENGYFKELLFLSLKINK